MAGVFHSKPNTYFATSRPAPSYYAAQIISTLLKLKTMSVQTTTSNDKHTQNFDPQTRFTVEMEDTSAQIAIKCACGFTHQIKTEGEIDLTTGYNTETKSFEPLIYHEKTERFYFHENYPDQGNCV